MIFNFCGYLYVLFILETGIPKLCLMSASLNHIVGVCFRCANNAPHRVDGCLRSTLRDTKPPSKLRKVNLRLLANVMLGNRSEFISVPSSHSTFFRECFIVANLICKVPRPINNIHNNNRSRGDQEL